VRAAKDQNQWNGNAREGPVMARSADGNNRQAAIPVCHENPAHLPVLGRKKVAVGRVSLLTFPAEIDIDEALLRRPKLPALARAPAAARRNGSLPERFRPSCTSLNTLDMPLPRRVAGIPIAGTAFT
jgi:hypothetical protein